MSLADMDAAIVADPAGAISSEALAEWDTAIRLDPAYAPRLKQQMAEAHNNLGVTLTSAPGRLPDAIGHFRSALRLAPAYDDAHYNLGVSLMLKNNSEGAIVEYREALRLNPAQFKSELVGICTRSMGKLALVG